MPGKRTCFVIMGFHKKTDLETGRVLDLDKTYHNIIKPAAEEAGLDCVRADEIVHSGVIDVPMFRQILTADVVVADLSTLNPNAFYELGVRHALRPYTTIVIAESKLKYPFDVNHTTILTYEHLGTGIDYEEVLRFKKELKESMVAILAKQDQDSPVYIYLTGLQPPVLAGGKAGGAKAMGPAPSSDPTVSVLMTQAEEAMGNKDFMAARSLLGAVQRLRPADAFVTQRLALATYKSEQPNKLQALEDARAILFALSPETSNDTETLGLWGAVHKRLWDETKEQVHLDASIFAYEKGLYLRNDYYNGINLAFLLNVRASVSEPAEAIADFVTASRVRRRIVAMCQNLLNAGVKDVKERYWVMATLAEAQFGLGQKTACEKTLGEASDLQPDEWMRETTKEQLDKLGTLLVDSPLKHLHSPGNA